MLTHGVTHLSSMTGILVNTTFISALLDFVIIGGDSANLSLASRLTELPHLSGSTTEVERNDRGSEVAQSHFAYGQAASMSRD
ncbi:hypothetical protein PsYK624_054620 [Phanerochaete sordida]|uniref:Uncharacterized protein n=1 Tax=Phanerochaete sordida TaxID=48140 RepID=A0A9P3G6U6_9APHY|nr:hypothetical protein PsYK624_054620 [Phanerochaete sordida]